MQIDGKLHSCSNASSCVARATDLTKMQTCDGGISLVHRASGIAHLVKLKVVQQVVELPVLLLLLQLEVVLLETM